MNNTVFRSIFILVLCSILGGCAVGQKIDYNNAKLELNASGNILVAIASQDSRSYVKNKEYASTYVGTFRGGYGNAFNVLTESGKPLADDMASVICSSLVIKGFSCHPVMVDPNELQVQITSKLKATNAKRLMFLTISEWYSDTYMSTGLTYDISLVIMDNQGTIIAEKKFNGGDDLGKSLMNPGGFAKKAVPEAYKKKLASLLNDPAVIEALK
ncbi:MAG: hypothetical protein WCK93_06315 [Nitrosomonadales bacterium]